ncbi:hypothetical protein JYU34_016356 [Plutella xylostella]|uniref:Uncharacterized protein n=1 Tax=Plutella xylostella TaxID=51655 RepID=A0ABQ7Q2M3_PLUXY|nr:hypothetical protein JYU34_016356 [Plutella xylostella]
MRTLSVRARKSSGSEWETMERAGGAGRAGRAGRAGASCCGAPRRRRSIRSAGTRGSWRPVVLGACEKPSLASRLSRITRRLCTRAFSFSLERQVAQASCSGGQATSAAATASQAASSSSGGSRRAGLARGPRGAPRGRVVRQSGRGGGVARRCAAADGACYTAPRACTRPAAAAAAAAASPPHRP